MIRNYFIFTILLLSIVSIWGMERTTLSQKSSVDLFSFDRDASLFENFNFIDPNPQIQINWDIEDKYLPDVQLESNEGILDVFTFLSNAQGNQTLPDETVIDSQTFDLIKQHHTDCIIKIGNKYWIPMLDRGIREYDTTSSNKKLIAALNLAINDKRTKLYINPAKHVDYVDFRHNVWYRLFNKKFFSQLIPDESRSITLTFVLNPKDYINEIYAQSIANQENWNIINATIKEDRKNTKAGLMRSVIIIFDCIANSKRPLPSDDFLSLLEDKLFTFFYNSDDDPYYFNPRIINFIKNFIQNKDSTNDFELYKREQKKHLLDQQEKEKRANQLRVNDFLANNPDYIRGRNLAIAIALLLGGSLLIFRKQLGNWLMQQISRKFGKL
jgi:hypothetical protein